MPDPEEALHPQINLLTSPEWEDYELLDSGNGAKLERYGAYNFVRPEHQAIWRRALPEERWQAAHATFRRQPGRKGAGSGSSIAR